MYNSAGSEIDITCSLNLIPIMFQIFSTLFDNAWLIWGSGWWWRHTDWAKQLRVSQTRPEPGPGLSLQAGCRLRLPAPSLLHPHGGAAHSHCTMRNFSGSRESVFLMIPLSDLIHDTLYNDCKGQWSFKFIFGSSGLVSLRALTLSLQLSLAPETLSLSLSPHRPRMLPGPTEAV